LTFRSFNIMSSISLKIQTMILKHLLPFQIFCILVLHCHSAYLRVEETKVGEISDQPLKSRFLAEESGIEIPTPSAGSGLNPAIYTVISSATDLSELCYTFTTLFHAKGYPTAPVLAFTSNTLLEGQKHTLRDCLSTDRALNFYDISQEINYMPTGYVDTPFYSKNHNYEYSHIERFLVQQIWSHPAVESHDVLMRVSDNSCITKDHATLPGLPSAEVSYLSVHVPGTYETARKYTRGLYDFTFFYMSTNGITPANPELWVNVVNIRDSFDTLPLFESEFEVVRKEFMQQPIVAAYHDAVVNESDYGFYRHMWSSNYVRYLTMGIFGKWEETSYEIVSGFMQKDFFTGHTYEGICRHTVQ